MADMIGKIPPHSMDAERSTLGALLIDKEAIVKVADLLVPEDFYHDAHGIIYKAVLDLYERRMPIDLITLTAVLEDKQVLTVVGGASALAELTSEVPTATHIFEYATIVKRKSTLRKLIKAGDRIAAFGYDEATDLELLLEQAEKSLFEVTQTLVHDRFTHIKEILNMSYERIANLHDPENRDKYRGIATGFSDIDNMLSGLQPTDLIIVAARPSMGKTSFALNVAQNVAKRGLSVGIISLEMSKEQLVERMFCALLGVDSWKMRTGRLTEEDFQRLGTVMDELNTIKIFIDDSSSGSIGELRAKARRLQMEHGLDFLVVDYLQMMTGTASRFGQTNRVQEISEISRSLKSLARELRIPIMALSQLSRAVEQRPSKIPQLSDLRESGSIEQDSDVVLMIYREDYYEENTDRAGITDVFIRKHRNGPVGRIELAFKKEQMKFLTIEKHRRVDEYAVTE